MYYSLFWAFLVRPSINITLTYVFFLIETVTIPNKRPRNFLAVLFYSLDGYTIPTHLK